MGVSRLITWGWDEGWLRLGQKRKRGRQAPRTQATPPHPLIDPWRARHSTFTSKSSGRRSITTIMRLRLVRTQADELALLFRSKPSAQHDLNADSIFQNLGRHDIL
jgi:hypothetical protein